MPRKKPSFRSRGNSGLIARPLQRIAITVFLVLFSGGCADVGFNLDAFNASPSNLAANPDTGVQAAGASSDEVNLDKEARAIVAKVIRPDGTLDLELMNQAVKLRPQDGEVRLQRAAFIVATGFGDQAELDKGRAWSLLENQGPYQYVMMRSSRHFFLEQYLDVLKQTMGKVDGNSGAWRNLQKEFCANARLYLVDLTAFIVSEPGSYRLGTTRDENGVLVGNPQVDKAKQDLLANC
jgi:hypothetical protein